MELCTNPAIPAEGSRQRVIRISQCINTVLVHKRHCDTRQGVLGNHAYYHMKLDLLSVNAATLLRRDMVCLMDSA